MERGRSQDRPINLVSKKLETIKQEKEYLSQFIEKKYSLEESKQKLEEQIKEQQINIEVLNQLKEAQKQYELQREKVKVSESTIKEYQRTIDEIIYKKGTSSKEKTTKQNFIPIITAILFIVLSILSVFIIKNDIVSAITIVFAIINILYVGYEQYRRKLAFHTAKQKRNKDKEKMATQVEIMQESIKKLEKQKEEQEKKMQTEYEKALEKIRNSYIGMIPIKTIDELLSKKEASIEIEVAKNKIGESKLKLQSIGLDRGNIIPKLENLGTLEEEAAKLEEEYKILTFQNEAIELAKQELEQAYSQMKKKVTPQFTTKLSQIMKEISNGIYTNIKLDEKDGLIVEMENRRLYTNRIFKHWNN